MITHDQETGVQLLCSHCQTLPKPHFTHRNTATTNAKDAKSKQTTLAPSVNASHKVKAPESTFRNGRLYLGAFKHYKQVENLAGMISGQPL